MSLVGLKIASSNLAFIVSLFQRGASNRNLNQPRGNLPPLHSRTRVLRPFEECAMLDLRLTKTRKEKLEHSSVRRMQTVQKSAWIILAVLIMAIGAPNPPCRYLHPGTAQASRNNMKRTPEVQTTSEPLNGNGWAHFNCRGFGPDPAKTVLNAFGKS
jgi:hypothetical protein